MIKFFRKIRYDLLEKNKIGKYLKYAIGEILLVVIGILIALWINNKNNEYNNGKVTQSYLADFKRDLETDIKTLDEVTLKNEKMIKNTDSIRGYIGKKALSEKESNSFRNWVNSLMFESYFVPEKTTIRQFESTNSSQLIKSKTLKDLLFTYYTISDRNENNMEKSVQLYQHNYLSKDLLRLYKSDYNAASSTFIVDMEKLQTDFEFFTSLNFKNALSKNQNKKYHDLRDRAENLIELINSELE
jgi:ribosomal protein S17E